MNLSKSVLFVITVYLVAIFATGFYACSLNSSDDLEITNAYKIVNYDVVADVGEDNVISMTESITAYYNVGYFSHGIYRYLPLISNVGQIDENGNVTYQSYRCTYEDVKCNTDVYVYTQNQNLVLRIGDPSFWVDGKTITYNITYKIDIGADRNTNKDIFYFNMIGNGWNSSIENANITINLPKQTTNMPTIYFGEYGSIQTAENFEFDGITLKYSHQNLKAGEGLTVKIDLEDGYFNRNYFSVWNLINLCCVVVLLLCSVVVYTKYSNKTPLTPIVNFTAPNGLTSADIGFTIDKHIHNKDIASLIIYWANKGYLQIEEKDGITNLIKLKDIDKHCKLYESIFFNNIFKDEKKVSISSLSGKLSESITTVASSIEVENKECFSNKSFIFRELICILTSFILTSILFYIAYVSINQVFIVLSFVGGFLSYLVLNRLSLNLDELINKKGKIFIVISLLLFIAFVVLYFIFAYNIFFDNYGSIFVGLISFIVTCVIVRKFNVRTDIGMKHLGDIAGLKTFIEVTEKERLNMLLKDNPKLFYDILPYAYVLGIYEDWCKKFEGLTIVQPDWLINDGQNGTFVFNLFVISTMNNFSTTLQMANVIKVKNSLNKLDSHFGGSGGGFSGGSGGGFSGGGFGGGGGGSW